MRQRVFFEWKAGAWISTEHEDFVNNLIALINQYGPPDLVEVRESTR